MGPSHEYEFAYHVEMMILAQTMNLIKITVMVTNGRTGSYVERFVLQTGFA